MYSVELSRCPHHCMHRGACWGTAHSQPSCKCHSPYKGRYCEIEEVYNEWWFWSVVGVVAFLIIAIPVIMCFVTRAHAKKRLKGGEFM
ncbi:unnamed protein product, partial [Mesorhabditis spiculigera]